MTEQDRKKRTRKERNPAPPWILVVLAVLLVAVSAGAGCTAAGTDPDGRTKAVSPVATPAAAVATPAPTAAAPGTATEPSPLPLRRIIVTNADAAELLLAIGAQDEVVGISDTVKNHPVLGPHYAGKTSIGSWQVPDIETIISLHPDAVISYSTYTPRNADKITAAGIPLLLIDCYKIDTLASDTIRLGNLTGREEGAEKYLAFLDRYETLVKSRTAGISSAGSPRVYFESYSDYSALTGGSGGDLLVTMAGGENLAGPLPVSSPKVNAEWVLAQNPDVIIKVAASGKNATELQEIKRKVAERAGIANTGAMRTGQVYVMSNSITYGPRSVIGLLYLSKIFHPDEYADIRPGDVLDEYARTFVPGANTTPVFSEA